MQINNIEIPDDFILQQISKREKHRLLVRYKIDLSIRDKDFQGRYIEAYRKIAEELKVSEKSVKIQHYRMVKETKK